MWRSVTRNVWPRVRAVKTGEALFRLLLLTFFIFEKAENERHSLIRSAMAASVPVDSGFRWDGTTSDLAQQYYRRFQADDTLPQRTYSKLPNAITKRLKDVGTTFDKLPGLLQRALVWDSGYVENGNKPDELVRVQTLDGVSMAEIAVSLPQYQTLAGCTAYTCTQPDGVRWYKNDKCSSTDLLKTTHCLVDAFESGEDPHLAMWSTGGNDTAIPAMRLLKHKWNVSRTFYEVAAIHTAEEAVEPKYDQCVINSSDKTRKGFGSLVIACESPGTVSSAMKAKMAAPKPGAMVSAWLQRYTVTAAPTGAPVVSPTASPVVTTAAPSSASTSSMGVIVAASAGIVVVPMLIGFIIWFCRRRPGSRRNDDVDGGYRRSLPTPYPPDAMDLAKERESCGTENRSTGSTDFRPSSYSIDDSLRGMYHAVLHTLVDDPRLENSLIPFEQVKLENQLASGAFGEVWVGYWNRDIVAIKRLLRNNVQTCREVEAFAQEIQLSARLHHPNIVRFIGVSWNKPEDLCVVMEFLPAGDLSKVLKESGEQLKWSHHKLSMARGLASAITYLHSQSPVIIHRDLKSKNVLLSTTLEPKVIDFGVSRRKMDSTMTAGVGTPYWTAPEVLQGRRYTEKSDIYSFGVLLTELDTCQIPYHDLSNGGGEMAHLKILNQVVAGRLRPRVTDSCPDFIREIVVSCLRHDPATRPTAVDLVRTLATVEIPREPRIRGL